MSQTFCNICVCDSFWNKSRELTGIEQTPRPANCPDVVPSDYYLFQSIAHFLRLRRFNNKEELETTVKEFFALKYKNWHQRGIKELAERWL